MWFLLKSFNWIWNRQRTALRIQQMTYHEIVNSTIYRYPSYPHITALLKRRPQLPTLPIHRRNLLNNPSRNAHSHTPSRDILRDNRSRRNRASLPDGHSGQNDDVPTDPAVVADDDGFGVLDVVAAALHLGLVRGVHDGHVGAEHDPVADGDEAAVEDREVEVGVEAAS